MKRIESRQDIQLLVAQFYAKVRTDAALGPIFNTVIPEEKWPEHLDKLTDFWETSLFGVQKYKGNPLLKHQHADAVVGNKIENEHFGKWLYLWFQTLDELFIGELAQRAKDAARNMSVVQFVAIWKARNTTH